MQNTVRFKDLQNIAFKDAWDYQKERFEEVWDVKKKNKVLSESEQLKSLNYLLFCEHPHVYTIGKSGKDSNLLVQPEQLKAQGAELFHIDRGGDITYHGPGQIVGYPIIDLQAFKLGIKEYVHRLEEAIILCIADYGLKGERLKGATGVWLDPNVPGKTRKICAIGVKASHFVSMHGFAFNVNTDLNYFNLINPCGFTDKGVTTLSLELQKTMDMQELKENVLQKLAQVFEMSIENY